MREGRYIDENGMSKEAHAMLRKCCSCTAPHPQTDRWRREGTGLRCPGMRHWIVLGGDGQWNVLNVDGDS